MRLHILLLGTVLRSVLPASEAAAPLGVYTPAERRHWAFRERSQPQPPKFTAGADTAWVRSPVDAFLLARLKHEGLRPAPEASPATLIRRLYFDLTGLPPAPRDVAAFVADHSRDAYAKLVERLLASPRYGERWAQHWLDVVRFSETDGFEYDTHRREAWRYRDSVIRAFNEDKPYDRFIREQLAGDEMIPANDDALVAAGFNRLGPLRQNAGNQEVASSRNEVLMEMTNAVGAALLGVTLGCARCHDHKFDPIRQSDYYRMQAFFAATYDHDPTRASERDKAEWEARAAPIQAEIKKLKARMNSAAPAEKEKLAKALDALQEKMPEPLPALFTVREEPARATPVHLLARGDYRSQGLRVGMRVLGVLLPDGAPELPAGTAAPRTRLAEWIADPGNPLTARVMANRIWHYHFGRGIVGTPNDFGRMGDRPTHPELLDYLANQFVTSGFRVKHVHRLILMSSAYRQASDARNGEAERKDPENRLLWRFNRRRLEAEEIRDAMLAVSGRLNLKAGGPGVMVPIEEQLRQALYKPSQWAAAADPSEHDRRSIYLIAKRNLRLPFLEVFDAPEALVSCPRRESSTHAPQALELLNGAFSNRQAAALAERLRSESGKNRATMVDLAYRLAAGRAPNAAEKRLALAFLETQPVEEFALAVFNLNAFLYVN